MKMKYRINQPLMRARKHHPRASVVSTVLLVIVTTVLIGKLAAPASGHRVAVDRSIAQPKPHATVQAPASTLDTTYFSLKLPLGYLLQSSQSGGAGMLYTATIIHPSIDGSRIIGISISQLPAGGLSESSAYRARTLAPQTYAVMPLKVSGESINLATRLDHEAGEVVAFWPHATILATLSISTGMAASESDQVSNEASLRTLLKNWQWR